MSVTDVAPAGQAPGRPPRRIQDFIFARELAEVYLLLDHVSGRSDKSLAMAFDGDPQKGADIIKKVCNIGWPANPPESLNGESAATLLMAKDRLNYAAKPANGASIAFTILVAGDDEVIARRRASWRRWFGRLFPFGPARPPEPSENVPNTYWEADLPSRTSLAERAYPGLVATAGKFNRRIKYLVFLLFIWLILTCLLSWNIAAGRTALARLDAAKTTLAATEKRIAEIEAGESAKRQQAPPGAPAGNQLAAATLVQRYCEHPQTLPRLRLESGVAVDQFENSAQYQICDERRDEKTHVEIVRADVSAWLNSWNWVTVASSALCGSWCLLENNWQDGKVPPSRFDVWAAIIAEVLATAVLPICYGFLGAGAAVVRSIYAKMRESLLSPRDLTLAWGQLALGAVIGACIGLFVSPTSGGPQGVALISGASTLSLAALSFIAGFGVESVFVALESLIRRIFNVSPQPAQVGP